MSTFKLPKEDCSRGAPMERYSDPGFNSETPRSVRLFKFNLESGGYDNGDAYWGLGDPLWLAIDIDGKHRYTRAKDREEARMKLKIPRLSLIVDHANDT